MPTKRIAIAHEGDDLVCHHSGMTREECDYRCVSCTVSFVACPDRRTIYERAEVLRQTWPQHRLDKQEQREWEMDIPEATRVWDHMKRKQDGDQQR